VSMLNFHLASEMKGGLGGMAWDEEVDTKVSTIRNLTPLDIHNREFRRSFRGYDEDEVDEFLDLIVAEFERLMRDNDELRSKLAELESRIQHYRGLEETLKNSIVLAQKTADQVREAANKEADSIKEKALLEAERIHQRAEEDLRKVYNDLEECRTKVYRFKSEMRVYLQSQLEMVEKGAESILKSIEKGIES
jgi:cell division initiation protein